VLKISSAGCLGLSPAISLQFTVEVCAASKICEKFTKNPFWRVQGRSRSSMLIQLKSLSPVLVMISSMSVPMSNCFHTKRTNNGKITYFRGVPLFDALVRGEPPSLRDTKFCQQYTYISAHCFMLARDLVACLVLRTAIALRRRQSIVVFFTCGNI